MHKYESDLTAKEKRKLEWEKIKGMNFKEKITHVWTYHKLLLAAPVIAVFLIVTIVNIIIQNRYENVLSIAVINGLHVSDMDETVGSLKERLEIEHPHSTILIDPNFIFVDGALTMESVQKIVVFIAAGQIDLLITNEYLLANYIEQEMLLDLGEIFYQSELAQMNLVERYGIDISEFVEINQDYFGVFYEPVYLTVIVNVDLEEETLEGVTRRELIRRLYFALYN